MKVTKRIVELKPSLTFEEAMQEDWLREFAKHMHSHRLLIPVIETNPVFQSIKNKKQDTMKTVKVLPKRPEPECIYAEDVVRERVYFFDSYKGVIGIPYLNPDGYVCVQWANGSKSISYRNMVLLIEGMSKSNFDHCITVHQVQS